MPKYAHHQSWNEDQAGLPKKIIYVKCMRSCKKKKDDNKCVSSVLVDSCVTRWMSEVCRIEVRRGYGTTQSHQLSLETSSCLRTYPIGLCIICSSFFITLPNRKASPNGISVAKIPHTCYFNVTILPYALKLLYSGSRRNISNLFHPAHSGHMKIWHKETWNLLCRLLNYSI